MTFDTDVDGDADKGRLASNALLAVLDVVVSGVTLFLLYRLLVDGLGIEALGVWALVISTVSLAQVSSLGLAGGTVRYVSQHLARFDEPRAAGAAETTVLSVAVALSVGAFLLWPIAGWLLGLYVSSEWIVMARELLPYALGSFWLQGVGGAVLSGLDGCHRAGDRAIIGIITSPLILVLSLLLVPRLGLKGVALAQIIQYFVWTIVGWAQLRKYLPSLSIVPFRWSGELFLGMWRYGLNLQGISLLSIVSNPLVKALLSHFGGLSAVGYFEMANRLVLQLRGVLVAANQVLVPYYSKIAETATDAVRAVYVRNMRIVVILASLLFPSLIGLLPAISLLWIGHVEREFLVFGALVSVGWFANTLSVPAYFANAGGGWITRNLVGHVVNIAGLALFGIVGGAMGGAAGCVAGYALSLVVQSAVVVGVFQKAEGVAAFAIASSSTTRSLAIGVATAVLGFIVYFVAGSHAGELVGSLGSLGVVICGLVLAARVVPEIFDLAKLLIARIMARKAVYQ